MKSKYIKQIDSCIKQRWLSTVKGNYMEEFETRAAGIFGNKYGVSTCNGTSALYLALFCVSQGTQKKEVIIPAYGFHVSVSVICAFGLKPVFCDVDPETYTIDFEKCEALINKNTLAVMVLQPWGNIANLDKIAPLRKKYGVFFISDSSHAHEAKWNKLPIGHFFDINCASFGLGKIISGGELGIMTTDNLTFRDRGLLFSHTNRVPDDLITQTYKDISNNVGIKFRPHLFALLLALDDIFYRKKYRENIIRNINSFRKNLPSVSNEIRFQKEYSKAQRVYHMPTIELPKHINAEVLIKELNQKGMHVQRHNYKQTLNNDSITKNFYRIKVSKNLEAAESIIKKNIIQIYATDFLSKKNITELKNTLIKYAKL